MNKFYVIIILSLFINNISICQNDTTQILKEAKFYNNIDSVEIDSQENFSIGCGFGIKYFIYKPEGKYYEDDPRYKPNYFAMINIGIRLPPWESHFLIIEFKYYRAPIYAYDKDYDINLITLYYKYQLKLFRDLYMSPQIGYNLYSNKEKNYFFSSAIDLGIEYSLSNINLFIKNGINFNLFSGVWLPSFISFGVRIKF